jgi:hypothetical protein
MEFDLRRRTLYAFGVLNIFQGVFMSIVITSRPSKKTKTRRLSFLPRIALSVDLAGTQFEVFHVPLTETLFNMIGKKFNLQTLISVSHQQIDELVAPNTASTKKSPIKKTAKKRRP